MNRVSPPLRRILAALTALSVLVSPGLHLLHAQAMLRDAVACAPAAMPGHVMPDSPAPARPHSHGIECCDQCPTSCHAIGQVASAPGITFVAEAPCPGVMIGVAWRPVARAPHVLPFPLGPPLPSV
jgi:hypothetical protein